MLLTSMLAALLSLQGLLLSPKLFGQDTTGAIVGTIKDPTGAVLAGANITILNVSTNLQKGTKTNSTGDFTVPYLQPGTYSVTAAAPGFSTAQAKSVVLEVGQTVRTDLTLTVGATDATVTVNAGTIALDTDSPTIGQVINEKEIVDLPLNERGFTGLMVLQPGATTEIVNAANPGMNMINLDGARGSANGYLIDGMTDNEPWYQRQVIEPNPDAIQEFKEQTGTYSAEFGFSAAQVNISTKYGTNQLHGALWEFARNDAFDALNYCFQEPCPKKQPLHENQYGFSVGGPVYVPKIYNGRNRSFFFANLERQKVNSSSVSYFWVPTEDMQKGTISSETPVVDPNTGQTFAQDASGNYIIPQGSWSRLATVMLKTPGEYFPLPNSSGSLGNYLLAKSNPYIQQQQTYRFDQDLTKNDLLTSRFILQRADQTAPGLTTLGNATSYTATQTWNVSETHTFNANLVNQLRLGWIAYSSGSDGPAAPSSDVQALSLQNTYSQAGTAFPNIEFAFVWATAGGADNIPSYLGQQVWDYSDSITWIKGKHDLTFGFNGRMNYNDSLSSPLPLGRFTFNGQYTAGSGAPTQGTEWADFLTGWINAGQATLPTPYFPKSAPAYYIDQYKFAGFVNDNWKMKPRLTLNLGLRYDFQGLPWEENNHWFWRDLSAPGGALCTADKSLVDSGLGNGLYLWCGRTNVAPAPKKPFAPRVGFAYRPFSGDDFVVRGGFGIFFSQWQLSEFASSGQYPYTLTYNPQGQNFNDLYPTIPPGAPVTSADLGFVAVLNPPVIKNPYIEQWSLSVQKALRSNTKLDVGYVGSKGLHLEGRTTPSQPNPYDPNAPYAGYPLYNFGTFGQNGSPCAPGQVIEGLFGFKSNYNGLLTSVEHQSKDLALLASYTWSSSMDNASDAFGTGLDAAGWSGPMNSHDINADYSKSSFDVNQRFVASFVYGLPFGRGQRIGSGVNRFVDEWIGGWQANGVYEAQTGIPQTIYAQIWGGNLQTYGERADIVGDPHKPGPVAANPSCQAPSKLNTIRAWFNPCAFVAPAANVYGNTPRNSMRTPGVNNLDFSLLKNFAIREGMKFQLRFEGFNVFNHADFGDADDNVNDGPAFGTISWVQMGARQVQLAGKLTF